MCVIVRFLLSGGRRNADLPRVEIMSNFDQTIVNTMLKTITRIAAAFAAICLSAACAYETVDNNRVISGIIPAPRSVKVGEGAFNVKGATFCLDEVPDEASVKMLTAFAEQLSKVSGKTCAVVTGDAGINFTQSASVPDEGYEMEVREDGVKVTASSFNGFFYAVQTIKQMLPVSIYGGKRSAGDVWMLPCCKIQDSPRFGYRGVMIDDCRHFFGKEEVKKILDIMSVYKLNRMHWHLTDDQGWRIEIKRYPKLTEIGSVRAGTQVARDRFKHDSIPYGGYYTQEDILEVVAYAQDLGITIIPEVDLPGHMVAALTAYPELGCNGGPYEVRTGWGIADEALCPGKEVTFEFLENVLGEIADLFPSEYFNIGGDECKKGEWEKCPDCQARIKALGLKTDENATKEQRLQNYVTDRVQAFLATKGKKIIGWDEILEGELAPGATVMSWRGAKGGIKAAKMGYDVVMAPNNYCYLDYVQSEEIDEEPRGQLHVVTLEKLYSLDPCRDIPEECQHHILGVQGNMWTEYIATPEHFEYMLLPRLTALSEVQWCIPENRELNRFKAAVTGHEYPVFEIMGYNYRK